VAVLIVEVEEDELDLASLVSLVARSLPLVVCSPVVVVVVDPAVFLLGDLPVGVVVAGVVEVGVAAGVLGVLAAGVGDAVLGVLEAPGSVG
jgi:hypothetical protein